VKNTAALAVNEHLLVDTSHTFQITNSERALRAEIIRMGASTLPLALIMNIEALHI